MTKRSTKKTRTIDGVTVTYPGGTTLKEITAIIRAADTEGTIQAEDMARLFAGYRPALHTTTRLVDALAILGARLEA